MPAQARNIASNGFIFARPFLRRREKAISLHGIALRRAGYGIGGNPGSLSSGENANANSRSANSAALNSWRSFGISNTQRFCSGQCRPSGRSRHNDHSYDNHKPKNWKREAKNCEWCGVEFMAVIRSRNAQRFCSEPCRTTSGNRRKSSKPNALTFAASKSPRRSLFRPRQRRVIPPLHTRRTVSVPSR